MARNVIAIYPDPGSADAAVAELLQSGVPREQIGLVRHHAVERYRDLATLSDEQRKRKARAGFGGGLLLGGATGALIALAVAAVPGFWIIGGPALSLLAGGGIGAAVGGAAGGIGAAFDRWGIPEGESKRYQEALRQGGTLLAVEAPDGFVRRVVDILERHGPIDLDRSARPLDRVDGSAGTEGRLDEEPDEDLHHIPGALIRSYPAPEEPEPA